MIIIKLMGGLGNQMFQYATGRALSARLKTDLLLDTSGFKNMHPDDTPREYELDDFPIRAKIATSRELSRVKPPGAKTSLKERVGRRVSSKGPLFTYGESSRLSPGQFKNLRNNTYLVGWWQDEAYFRSIKSQLIEEFTPIKLSLTGKKYKRLILTTEQPVSLHVRRGDYISNIHAQKHHGIAPLNYFQSAMGMMEKKLGDPTFVVFSDDIAWCKKNIKADNIVYVENTAAGFEDLYLMSLCEHNIIANSSFSWWGAWLNKNANKIVIAPKVWFKNKESDNATNIVPKDWIRM